MADENASASTRSYMSVIQCGGQTQKLMCAIVDFTNKKMIVCDFFDDELFFIFEVNIYCFSLLFIF